MATVRPTAFAFAREITRISGWRLFPKKREQAAVRTPVGERETAQLESEKTHVQVFPPQGGTPLSLCSRTKSSSAKKTISLRRSDHASVHVEEWGEGGPC